MQTWPDAIQTPIIAAAEAASRSASGKMMNGLFPPSSSCTGLTPLAAAAWIAAPVCREPVNEIMSTPGCSTSAAPASPSPWTMLRTPGGSPASRATSAISTAVIGVCSAGLRTTQLPAAIAAATKAKTADGPFHGTISPRTPLGSRSW